MFKKKLDFFFLAHLVRSFSCYILCADIPGRRSLHLHLPGLTHLLQHLLRGVELLPVIVQTQVQVPNLLPLSLHLVCQHTHLQEGQSPLPSNLCAIKYLLF